MLDCHAVDVVDVALLGNAELDVMVIQMTETTSQDSIRARLDGDTVRNVLLHAFLSASPFHGRASRPARPVRLGSGTGGSGPAPA
ncbi:hypothetical protein C9J85_03105 [Haloferax sp. wsp5]|nr:hypothetical protein C9J85_03105 [Haloferax sp. wsp5]